ncbi:conserved hypothetical protein [Ricinus communis]|uniref:Uncharacterized protein n=1 Tax=Ricinus communis TaxID=3988 RepID=B9RQJ5_RICCO|nr:conserved hypothetical protein [Ricinus communis]
MAKGNAIELLEKLKERLAKPWENTMVVDLENDFYLVKLSRHEDVVSALLGGPWVVFGHYLTVQSWAPSFRASSAVLSKVIAWIHFPDMPMHYYHNKILRTNGNIVGRTVKIDFNIEEVNHDRFARVAVELDLSKPLIAHCILDGVRHNQVLCLFKQTTNKSNQVGPPDSIAGSTSTTTVELDQIVAENFGPWMIAVTRGRRGSRKETKKIAQNQGAALTKQVDGSRFSVLNIMHEDIEECHADSPRTNLVGMAALPIDNILPKRFTIGSTSKCGTSKGKAKAHMEEPLATLRSPNSKVDSQPIKSHPKPQRDLFIFSTPCTNLFDNQNVKPNFLIGGSNKAKTLKKSLPPKTSAKKYLDPGKKRDRVSLPIKKSRLNGDAQPSPQTTRRLGVGEYEMSEEKDAVLWMDLVEAAMAAEEARSFSGGIWLLWNALKTIVLEIHSHRKLVHFCINEPWVLAGDFNVYCSLDEKVGGLPARHSKCKELQDNMDKCSLMDLGILGPKFTWERGLLKERLDCAVCNMNWKLPYWIKMKDHSGFKLLGSPILILIIFSERTGLTTKAWGMLPRTLGTRISRNSRYFHGSIVIRRKKNRIESLKDTYGCWLDDIDPFKKMVVKFYTKLYTEETTSNVPIRIRAQEVMHSMELNKGKNCWMATKINLEKAYDTLQWEFIQEMLEDASLTQVAVIQEVLKYFCRDFSQRVNDTSNIKKEISSKFSFTQTKNLWRYLGMPLIHERVGKHTFRGVLESIRHKLSG